MYMPARERSRPTRTCILPKLFGRRPTEGAEGRPQVQAQDRPDQQLGREPVLGKGQGSAEFESACEKASIDHLCKPPPMCIHKHAHAHTHFDPSKSSRGNRALAGTANSKAPQNVRGTTPGKLRWSKAWRSDHGRKSRSWLACVLKDSSTCHGWVGRCKTSVD